MSCLSLVSGPAWTTHPPFVWTVVWGGSKWLPTCPSDRPLWGFLGCCCRNQAIDPPLQPQTTQKHSDSCIVQLFHSGFATGVLVKKKTKLLSPWETPLKLSLYVIYTENKARAKNHKERLFKHNRHNLWKIIKACSLIVNVHIFRMSSFKKERLHLMSASQNILTALLDKLFFAESRKQTKQLAEDRQKQFIWKPASRWVALSRKGEIIKSVFYLEKLAHLEWTQAPMYML